jgi:hypothetical protein
MKLRVVYHHMLPRINVGNCWMKWLINNCIVTDDFAAAVNGEYPDFHLSRYIEELLTREHQQTEARSL